MTIKHVPGEKYGRLVLLERASRVNYWLCACACGKNKEIFIGNLVKGASTSCGCYSAEVAGARFRKHGESSGGGRSKLYNVYSSMLRRCDSPNTRSYKDYGGRGITVCDRWRLGENGAHGLVCFIADMGESYAPGLQLDRRDNNAGYSTDNCHWVTRTEQARNKRNVHFIDGVPKTLYAVEHGIDLSLAYRRKAKVGGTLVDSILFLQEKKHGKIITAEA